MTLPTDLIQEFIFYFENKIEFHTDLKKYRLNNLWIEEIDKSFFDERVEELIESLLLVLISSNNDLLIIKELQTFLEDRIKWFDINNFKSFNSINEILSHISEIDHEIEYEIKEKYSLDHVLNHNSNPIIIEDFLFYSLITNKGKTSNYQNPLDFEKVKLHFVLNLFYDSLIIMREKIEKILTAISKYGVTNFEVYTKKTKINSSDVCTINLDKLSTAFLFKFLMEENIIQMDSIQHKSQSNIKKFAEKHFNYSTSKTNTSHPLTGFSKEISKLKGSSNKNKQLEVINLLIEKLQKKKLFLEK
jgi:hypothetical protein